MLISFTKKDFCDGMKRPLCCSGCRKIGHIRVSCPTENYNINPLPELTKEWVTSLSFMCNSLMKMWEPDIREIRERNEKLNLLEMHIQNRYPGRDTTAFKMLSRKD